VTHPPITYKTVTGTYMSPDGAAVAGSVRFVPSAAVLDSTGHVVVAATPITAVLAAGVLSVELACTDVVGTSPTGWVWQVSELFAGGRETTFQLPSAGGVLVYLADLLPPDSVDESYAYASQAAVAAVDARLVTLESIDLTAIALHPFLLMGA
jgi:hypothetical protein